MYGTDLMMLLNIILRGVCIYYVTISVIDIVCIDLFLKIVTNYTNMALVISDLVLLRTNTYIAFFINVPVFFISAGINGQER